MRVFVDTNVLVSAFATRGLCADILRLILLEHTIITAERVLSELEDVLVRKMGATEPLAKEISTFLQMYHVEPEPERPLPVPENDPDDQWIPASAVSADADVFITGDKGRLDLRIELHRPVIVTPREFWELVRKERESKKDGMGPNWPEPSG